MSWADDPPRVSGGAAQVSARAWSDGPDALLDQAPRGLYRIQIRGVGGQELQRRAALFDELADAPVFVCPEIVQDDDVPRPQSRGEAPATHATKRSALAVCQLVRIVSQRSARIAPIIVKLSPPFIGRGSTTTAPRWTHACDRPIARFAPDSSTNTSRAGSTPVAHWRNAARLARTSGRSCSAGRGRFFKHVSRPPQRAQDTRPMDPVRQGHPPGVYARQFPGGGIRRVPDDRVHHLEHHG